MTLGNVTGGVGRADRIANSIVDAMTGWEG